MGWFWADGTESARGKKCPVDHATLSQKCPVNHSATRKCPVDHPALAAQTAADHASAAPSAVALEGEAAAGSCPVSPEARQRWSLFGRRAVPVEQTSHFNPNNNMPELSSQKMPGQQLDLPTQRTMSTIPRGAETAEGVWEYPSPQQMFNAMVRKSGSADEIPEDAVEPMVDVHNFLNEGAWQEILKWEQPYTNESHVEPRLLKFTGRYNDLSPRAAWLQVLGRVYPSRFAMPMPFDRHDWTVLRATTPAGGEWQKVRYVIDYYEHEDTEGGDPSFVLDVRPALDSIGAAVDRVNMATDSAFYQALGWPKPYKRDG